MTRFVLVQYNGEPTRLGVYGPVEPGQQLTISSRDWSCLLAGNAGEPPAEFTFIRYSDVAVNAGDAVPEVVEAPEPDEPELDTVAIDSYESLTVAALKEQATLRGLEIPQGGKKADLVALLQADDNK